MPERTAGGTRGDRAANFAKWLAAASHARMRATFLNGRTKHIARPRVG